jgi:hypothetical protein
MDSGFSPWDALDELNTRAGTDASFPRRWRAFVRSCGELVKGAATPEALCWLKVADDFDCGLRSAAELDAAFKEAWAFFLSVQDSLPWPTQNALLIVMTSLGTGFDADRWYERAWHFFHSCETAGATEEQLAHLLSEHFGPLESDGSGRVA